MVDRTKCMLISFVIALDPILLELNAILYMRLDNL